ncbi:MAG: hypothetical protein RLY78_3065 [Pseudomonadota bacterium]
MLDYSTVCRRQKSLQAQLSYRPSAKILQRRPSPGAESRHEAGRAGQRLGPGIWKTWSGDHRRSLVETQMHCLKRLGERVTARTFERQVVALHVRLAVLNRFSQLGRPQTVRVGAVARVRLGWGSLRARIGLCNKAPVQVPRISVDGEFWKPGSSASS